LHRPGKRSTVDVVRHLVGVQAQVIQASALALRARSTSVTMAAATRARVRDRSVVLTWAMRGTMHLIAAEDYRSLVPVLTEPHIARSRRRLAQEGVPPSDVDRAMDAIERILGRDGPMTRTEIAGRLRRSRIRTEGQAIAHLMWLAAAERSVCFGPHVEGTQTFVLARDWIEEESPRDRDRTLAELAVRYVRAHAPCTPADLAWWSGIRLRDADRAWRAVADRLEEIELDGVRLWRPKGRPVESPPGTVRLLPAFDEYLLGWKDRSFAVGAEHRRKVNKGGGWIHPVVVRDGEVIGLWKSKAARSDELVGVELFGEISPLIARRVNAEAKEVVAFIAKSRPHAGQSSSELAAP